ncbi:hypothetical protein GJ496_010137 [Pomphorhynchus laevis]|nr:hypothetical protein GJ496_010137 [Pomphorhynchus laevis]
MRECNTKNSKSEGKSDFYVKHLKCTSADTHSTCIQNQVRTPDQPYQSRPCKELDIHIIPDKDNKQLHFIDTIIGMTKGDIVNNLGTIARSGTRAIMEALQSGADISMIGQFGVCFYSSNLITDKVTVVSKHNDDEHYIWESSADRNFTVRQGTREDQLEEYLEEREIKDIVKKHTQYFQYPIMSVMQKKCEREMSDDEGEPDESDKNEENKMNVDELSEKDDEEKSEKDVEVDEIGNSDDEAISKKVKNKNKMIRKNVVKRCLELIDELTDEKIITTSSTASSAGTSSWASTRTRPTARSSRSSCGLRESDKTQPERHLLHHRREQGSDGEQRVRGARLEKWLRGNLYDRALDEYCVQQLKEFDGKKLVSQSRKGGYLKSPRILSMLYRVGSIRLVSQHGTDNEGTGPARHEHYGLHCHEEEYANDTGDKSMKDLVVLLFESSLLASGFSLEHPEIYWERINWMIELGIGIDDDADALLDGIEGKGNAAAVSADESDATRIDDVD